jgi:hypothetical protein
VSGLNHASVTRQVPPPPTSLEDLETDPQLGSVITSARKLTRGNRYELVRQCQDNPALSPRARRFVRDLVLLINAAEGAS